MCCSACVVARVAWHWDAKLHNRIFRKLNWAVSGRRRPQVAVIALAVLSIVVCLLGHDATANVLGMVLGGEVAVCWAAYLVQSRNS